MIKVAVTLDAQNVISSLEAAGHAKGRRGGSVVCAALSFLVRTAARSFEAVPGIQVSGGADQTGELWFRVHSYPESENVKLKSFTDFCLLGLKDLSSEYPKEVKVIIEDIFLKE